jgi:hypothetical protein
MRLSERWKQKLVSMAGKSFDLTNDDEILKINSPKDKVNGPYKVIYKDLSERWAIVALDWNKKPQLGIRWFWGNGGNPFSSAHPIWLVIPSALTKNILSGLPIDHQLSGRIDDFLCGKITGPELMKH